jgi:hypothetical protein
VKYLLLLLLSLPAFASQAGRDNTVNTILLLADWRLSRNMVGNPGYEEINPLVPDSRGGVDTFFVGAVVGYYLAQAILPERFRYAVMGIEVWVVRNNIGIGVRF